MKWLSRILTVIVTMSMACGALIFNRRHQQTSAKGENAELQS